MTDKVQKIREEVERIQLYTQSETLKQVLEYIDKVQKEEILPKFPLISQKKCMYTKDDFTDEDRKVLCDGCKEDCEYAHKEEPVSEDLEEAVHEYMQHIPESEPELMDSFYTWEQMEAAFKAGAKWQKTNLWKPADGDDLPEYEREVVVFTQNFPDDAGIMSVAIGHRPNPEGWDGKSLSTGKVEHYTPKTYDKGGWNIPDIVYWLDVNLPKEIEL